MVYRQDSDSSQEDWEIDVISPMETQQMKEEKKKEEMMLSKLSQLIEKVKFQEIMQHLNSGQ